MKTKQPSKFQPNIVSSILALYTFSLDKKVVMNRFVNFDRRLLRKLESMNNKIKVLKRVAFGYRDFSYFKLRIMSAFRGVNAY